MVTSPMGILLFVAALFRVIKSPKRTETLTRMVVAFIATLLAICLPAAVLRIGDSEPWGRLTGLVGLLVAVIVGQWHSRSPKASA